MARGAPGNRCLLPAARLAAALAALIALCLLQAGPCLGLEARAGWIPDGDTLHLEDGRRVRLAAIDAPETAGDGKPGQYFAREARECLRTLLQGLSLYLEDASPAKDRHGRLLAYVFLPDGRMVNEILLEQGCAFLYHHPGEPYALPLLEAQRRAMAQGRGFWPRILALPQPHGGWVGNSRSKRFHRPESPQARQISRTNRVSFTSLERAFYEGYVPARTSTPWPEE